MSEDSVLGPLLNKLETAHLEHLSPTATSVRMAQTVCAFLNTGGGTIVAETGAGLVAAKKQKAEIETDLRAQITPPALWSVSREEVGGKQFFLVDVPTGRDRPYMVNGTIYVRRGAHTLPARPEELRELVEASFSVSERWERKLIPDGNAERLDEKLIRATAEVAQRLSNYSFSDATKVVSILSDLAMFRERSTTQGAEVVFGLRPATQFPQVRVRVTVYAADKGGEFIDNKQFEKAAIPMLEAVFAVIRQHTPVAGTFPGGLRRADQPAFPEAAVREGLVNAFVHRDYANYGGGIAVDLYPGRLVIWNSGSLPEGIKIGDLKREHPSMPRNPDIAQVFFLRGFMERVGRGTQKILSACQEARLPPPEWKVDETGVTLTFHGAGQLGAAKLNLRERKLLSTLMPGESIRLPQYCDRLAVSERQARRDLGNLTENGWLEREGEGPSTVFLRTRKEWNPDESGQKRPK